MYFWDVLQIDVRSMLGYVRSQECLVYVRVGVLECYCRLVWAMVLLLLALRCWPCVAVAVGLVWYACRYCYRRGVALCGVVWRCVVWRCVALRCVWRCVWRCVVCRVALCVASRRVWWIGEDTRGSRAGGLVCRNVFYPLSLPPLNPHTSPTKSPAPQTP